MENLHLHGKTVVVSLYTREGAIFGYLTGRVTDTMDKTNVAPSGQPPMLKDLALVSDLKPCDRAGNVPEDLDADWKWRNSAGQEGDGAFAVSDIRVMDNNEDGIQFDPATFN